MKKYSFIVLIFVLFILIGCGKQKVEYTVTFNSNGAEFVPSQKIKERGRIMTPPTPQKEGYVFLGWYLDDELYDFTTLVIEDVTLSAKWVSVSDYAVVERLRNIDLLLNVRDSIPDLFKSNDKNNMFSNNFITQSYKNMSLTTDQIINSNDLVYEDLIPTRLEILPLVITMTTSLKSEMIANLDYFTEANDYVKRKDKNYFFKIVYDSTVENGIHYYSINVEEKTYIHLFTYYDGDIEVIEVSMTEPSRVRNACNSCSETRVYYNYGGNMVRFIESREVEDVYLGKQTWIDVYELQKHENGTFESVTMFQNRIFDVDESGNGDQDSVRINFLTSKIIIEPTGELFWYDGSLDYNYPSVNYYPNYEDPKLHIRLVNMDSGKFYMHYSPYIFNDLQYVAYETITSNGSEQKVATNIVTDSCDISLTGDSSVSLKDEFYLKKQPDGSYEQVNTGKYIMGLSIHYDNVNVMFDKLSYCSLKTDIQDIYIKRNEILDGYYGTEVFGLDFSLADAIWWEDFLMTNYIITYEQFTNIMESFTETHDVIPPKVTGSSVIYIDHMDDLYTLDFESFIKVFDDTDGEIVIDESNYTIVVDGPEQSIYIEYSIFDSSNNQTVYRINVKQANQE